MSTGSDSIVRGAPDEYDEQVEESPGTSGPDRAASRADDAGWALTPSRQVTTALFVVCYLALSYLVLYPILTAPVVADDYLNPFAQVNDGGPTFVEGIAYGWRGATDGASFRVIGTLVGSFVSWLLVFLSATFDVGITTLYTALKFVMIISCAVAVAWFWQRLALFTARPISFGHSIGFVSLALFGTLQIHAYWSNDPVANYPLVGFGATALGFGFLALVLRFLHQPGLVRALTSIVGAVVAVGYYELNVGAVMGAAVLMALFVYRQWGDVQRRRRILAGGAGIVLIPALLVVFGRSVTGDQAQSYRGTTIRAGSDALETFGIGILGSLPGAAWGLSIRTLGGTLGMVAIAIAVVVVLSSSAFGWVLAQPAERPGTARRPDLALVVVAAGAVGIYWVVATGLQALTVKVQEETLGLGYVYTSYCVGAATVALGIAVALRAVFGARHLWGYVVPIVVFLAVSFLLVQLTVNWRLSEQLNASLIPNRQLLDAFDDDATVPERCQALQNWTAGPWPSYYEDDMVEGLDAAYRYYFGEAFCSGFTRPP